MQESHFEKFIQKEDSAPQKGILKIVEKPLAIPLNKLSSDERKKRIDEIEQRQKIADKICEKYKKGDKFDFYLEKKTNIYAIILENIQVGALGIRDNIETKQIQFIQLNDNLKNKGFGKQLYIKLNEYFNHKDGSVLMTDVMKISTDATNLWNSLAKDGLVDELSERASDGHIVYKFKKK